MQKTLLLLLIFVNPIILHAQKTTINRKVAQKNYEGYVLMQEKKYKEALGFFNEAIKEDQEAYFIYQNRALCHLYLGDTLAAVSDFKRNVELDPLNIESRYNLGNIAKKQNDTTTSVNYFRQAISLIDEKADKGKVVYMNQFLANVFFSKCIYDSALIYIDKLKTIDTLNANNYIKSAVCNFHLNQHDALCSDLENAYILGAAVNCMILKLLCTGCEKPGLISKVSAPNSIALDKRLEIMLPETNNIIKGNFEYIEPETWVNKIVRVNYNSLWQICEPANAAFYREAKWTANNFFEGEYKDFYITGELYAEGTLSNGNNSGSYITYFKNGIVMAKGSFTGGVPSGKWNFYNKDGTPDFELSFNNENFVINFSDTLNPDYMVKDGTGKFTLLVERTGYLDYTLSGEYQKNKQHGTWIYKVGEDIAVEEEFKNGKFRKGFLGSGTNKLPSYRSNINALLFIPPHLLMIKNMLFQSEKSVGYHPFIKVSVY